MDGPLGDGWLGASRGTVMLARHEGQLIGRPATSGEKLDSTPHSGQA
jgi:hypothetical protein